MTETYPFLYVVSDHRLSCVKLTDKLSFGGKREDMDISDQTAARGHFIQKGNCWYLCCDAGTIFVNTQPLGKNKQIILQENFTIRFGDGQGKQLRNIVMVFSDSDHHAAGWRKINKYRGTIFGEDISKMEDGDSMIMHELPVFCFGDDVIYQDLGNLSTSVGAGTVRNTDSRNSTNTSLIGENVQIDIQDVTVGSILNSVTILKDIHVQLESGKMYLVLGGAGAGKTTFLEAVTGMVDSNISVRYRNQDLLEDEEARSHISFAPQFSPAHYRMEDTVYHTLDDAAKLYAPDDIANDPKCRKKRVMELLKLLDLENAAKKRCATLSGGMQKKLTIAIECIGDPDVMLLDEPDSGVDGNKVLEIMQFLRQTADDGKIICLISHTPDRISDLIDGVIVFGKASDGCGHLCYMGTVENSLHFFECQELEQIVNRIGDPKRCDEYIRRYESERSLHV